jgi:hypothetical protein
MAEAAAAQLAAGITGAAPLSAARGQAAPAGQALMLPVGAFLACWAFSHLALYFMTGAELLLPAVLSAVPELLHNTIPIIGGAIDSHTKYRHASMIPTSDSPQILTMRAPEVRSLSRLAPGFLTVRDVGYTLNSSTARDMG